MLILPKIISLNISVLFGIVCFREKFWETQSFKDIIKSYYQFPFDHQLHISIYDNTDLDDWDIFQDFPVCDNVIINYFRDSSNSGIAAAFNHFAELSKRKNTQWIVFLDQDTRLPEDFFRKYIEKSLTTNKNIAFPKVYIGTYLLSPSYYRFYRTSIIKNISEELILKHITAINSGMMIKTDFYFQNGGYNKNLRIDFCDHEFIERINNKNIFADIIDVSLYQEFSSKTNNKEKSIERYKIYIKDLNIYKKNKNKLMFFIRIDLPHLLKEIYRNRSLEFLKIRFNA